MTFLNGALLFGAFAFSIPLIIHLLNRSRFRTIDWGAMHLLDSITKVNHKRFRLEQLILLLVRCLLPVLLALCLARPVFTGANILTGDAPVSLVVLIDNSYSMDAKDAGETRFDAAIAEAVTLIEATYRGSEIHVILTGGAPSPLFDQPLFNQKQVVQRLKHASGGFGSFDVAGSLDEALTVLEKMSHLRRELVIISDFQSVDWESIDISSIASRIADEDVPVAISLLHVGDSVQENVSIDSLHFSKRALGVDQRLAVRAEVRNHSPTPFTNVRVTMEVDGEQSAVSIVQLPAQGTTQVLFPMTFDQPGSHVLHASVDIDDGVRTDNQFSAVVTVWDRLEVLLVDGAPSSEPLMGETDYLSVALSPFTFGRVPLADLVDTKTVSASELSAELLESIRVVVLANVAKLQNAQVEAIVDFVDAGGAVLVCAGDKIDLNWYRETLFADGKGVLPAPFGKRSGVADGQGGGVRILKEHFEHPALEFFNEPSHGSLNGVIINQRHQLEVNDDQIQILARLENGEPLLIEHPYGEGVVLQFATACDADWSTLPIEPVYVPLMQQLITTMAARISPSRNLITGEPAVAFFMNTTRDKKRVSETVSVETPSGMSIAVESEPNDRMHVARYAATVQPGIYTMSTSAETTHFAVEADRRESIIELLTEAELVSLAQVLPAEIFQSVDDYLQHDHLRRNGRETWKPLLVLVLVLMFLEVVLQQRFARRHP